MLLIPLLAIFENWVGKSSKLLTANCCAFLKSCQDGRVHLNEHVLVSLDVTVSLFHNVLNPLVKRVTRQGVRDIGYVLPMKFEPLVFNNWKCSHDLWVARTKLEHCHNLQPFKLRDEKVHDVFSQDHSPFASRNITEVPDGGHCILR